MENERPEEIAENLLELPENLKDWLRSGPKACRKMATVYPTYVINGVTTFSICLSLAGTPVICKPPSEMIEPSPHVPSTANGEAMIKLPGVTMVATTSANAYWGKGD